MPNPYPNFLMKCILDNIYIKTKVARKPSCCVLSWRYLKHIFKIYLAVFIALKRCLSYPTILLSKWCISCYQPIAWGRCKFRLNSSAVNDYFTLYPAKYRFQWQLPVSGTIKPFWDARRLLHPVLPCSISGSSLFQWIVYLYLTTSYAMVRMKTVHKLHTDLTF